MKPILYLHCGMYKTGSSFLQTMFVRNRDLLMSRGIHYPKSEKELEMYKGEISPGNGIHLSDSLSQDESVIINLLSADLAESKKMGMDTLLYSSERLFHQFHEKDTVHKLQLAAHEAGFGKIDALLYFRDPVSHALSTYKHRAKYGDHQDFSNWLQEKYEIFELIRTFLEYSEDSKIQWTCRRYKPDSAYMVRSSFVDWLGTAAPDIPDDDRVNPSLQLNEIRVLQSLKKEYPGCENFLREALLSLHREDKESEKGLKEEYSSLIAEKWLLHKPMLNSLNSLMNENEKLSIETGSKPSENQPFTSLSEKQIQAVAEGMKSYLNSQNTAFRILDIWERGLNKVRRKFAASRFNYKFPK
jgi:hypothetical protein